MHRFLMNALVLLRLLNTLVLILLLLRLPTLHEQIKQWKQYYDLTQHNRKRDQIGTGSSWSDQFPLLFPLDSVHLETIRLNELFAKPSAFRCRERKRATIIVRGKRRQGETRTFSVCNDFDQKNWDQQKGEREKLLIILSDRKNEHFRKNDEQKRKATDELFLGYMEFGDDKKKPLSDSEFVIKIEKPLTWNERRNDKNGQKMAYLIEQIEQLIERHKLRHLLLALRPLAYADADNRMAHSAVLFRWYQFVHELFFKWHFAILDSHSIGSCGQAMQKVHMKNCLWKISFVRFEHFGQVEDIPCFGTASPLEEKLRLLHFLMKDPTNKRCSALLRRREMPSSTENLPIFCASQNGTNFRQILYVRHKKFLLETDESKMVAKLSKFAQEKVTVAVVRHKLQNSAASNGRADSTMALIDVSSNCAKMPPNNVAMVNNISLLGTTSVRTGGTARPCHTHFTVPSNRFGTFLDQIVHDGDDNNASSADCCCCWVRTRRRRDGSATVALLLDLDGFEWEVLGTISRSSSDDDDHCANWVHSVGQLSLRLRLWQMEEGDNWRRFYLWLLRLQECGQFEKGFSRQIDQSNIQIVFIKELKI